jgi:hypothetical protein
MNYFYIKLLRWTGWLLLPLVLCFLATGYIMDGRYGFGSLLDEKEALTFHRMLHLPLILLVLLHSLAAAVLTLLRWGWIQRKAATLAERTKP